MIEGHLKFKHIGLALYFIIIIEMLIFKFTGYDPYIGSSTYHIIHIISELFASVAFMSMFAFIYYSYPYEREINYLAAGSLFLCAAITNVFHIYPYYNAVSCSVIFSSLSNIFLTIGVLLSLSLSTKNIKASRLTVVAVPLILTVYFTARILHKISENACSYCPLLSRLNSNWLFIGLILINLVSICIATKQYYIATNKLDPRILHGLHTLNLVFLASLLGKYSEDIFSIIGHTLKVISVFLITNSFFLANIKRPYEEIMKTRKFLEDASNIKTDFIVNLSHELRTPVNVILSATKVLNSGLYDEKYINSIEKNALRLKKVCEGILEFNEIENGGVSINYCKADVVYIIDDILEEADEIADQKNLEIEFNFDEKRYAIIDYGKFKSIVLNLISNAIKYVPRDGLIKIDLEIERSILVRVRHTGPGIPDSEVIRIFDKFYKLKDDELESTEGLGIGLYISKKYCELLGGSIQVINNENFSGYEMELPLVEGQEEFCPYNGIKAVKGFFTDINP